MFNWRSLFNKRLDPEDLELNDLASNDIASTDTELADMAPEDMHPQDMKANEIPVLDDIIKGDEDELVQDYPHLFSNTANESAAEETTGNTSREELETEEATVSTEIDDETNPTVTDESETPELSYTDTIETKAFETDGDVIIDLNDDISRGSEDIIIPVASAVSQFDAAEVNDTENHGSAINNSDSKEDQLTSANSEQLDVIVDKVIKHLMPDLEQQLRFLVQQALEKELPKEIINSLNKTGSQKPPNKD